MEWTTMKSSMGKTKTPTEWTTMKSSMGKTKTRTASRRRDTPATRRHAASTTTVSPATATTGNVPHLVVAVALRDTNKTAARTRTANQTTATNTKAPKGFATVPVVAVK